MDSTYEKNELAIGIRLPNLRPRDVLLNAESISLLRFVALIHCIGISSKLASGHHIKWTLGDLSNSFCRKCFYDTRTTRQKYDKAFAFVFNNIIKHCVMTKR
ncbi:hypothetical protein POX_h09384 [Penicillium oxalicum]|uniref:hypothetical protein n=1 Tax=Penicillium oxalicum TaxID=69781 RepID=UPI0020B76724|nr:hypothetical protein POX_h09384 [Penicillium oxalicum]KAI2785626.1 hypothetical protein POX_h09384 [Penicillium oxalicum]